MKYETIVFDCDGVVLHSNKIKTQAFYQATLPYGETAAQAMVDYHIANGGISRYKKFTYFLDTLVQASQTGPKLEELLANYAVRIREGLLSCEVAEGLLRLREQTAKTRWLIVSGGDQTELRDIFTLRGMTELFDGGIYGSPESKDEILVRELASGNIQQPALFLGDSKYDYQAATQAGLDFIFLRKWSEALDAESWLMDENITSKFSLEDCFND